jgi:hypothetical protein
MVAGIIAPVFILNLAVWSDSKKGLPIKSNIESGIYVHTRILVISDIRNLPVPKTNENYAFIQSIDDVCNVVVGKFTTGGREIIIYQDKNSDGKVDLAVHWLVDMKRFKYEAKPDQFCPAEKFKQMKEDILKGNRGELNPNTEGMGYMEVLMKDSTNVSKWYNGFRISMRDSDEPETDRVIYFFSDNKQRGVDMNFEVKYRNLGLAREQPLIKYAIFASGSKDPYLIQTVKNLMIKMDQFAPKTK